jgi:acetyl esterase/lipase
MPKPIPEPMRAPLVYSLPGMEQVHVQEELVYREIDGQSLHMDIYRPADMVAGERRPAVLFVHGDAPPEILAHAKDWGAYVSWGRLAALNGLVGVTFNHRSTERRTRMPDTCADVAAALDYVRSNAATLGIDPDRLCFWVCSAGGMKLVPVLTENPDYIRCIVAYYPLLDLMPTRETIPPEVSDETLQAYSAVNFVTGMAAPLLLARAGRDFPAFNQGIDRFIQAALTANAQLDLYTHPTGEHGFDVRNADERSREIIAHTLTFMRRHLLSN